MNIGDCVMFNDPNGSFGIITGLHPSLKFYYYVEFNFGLDKFHNNIKEKAGLFFHTDLSLIPIDLYNKYITSFAWTNSQSDIRREILSYLNLFQNESLNKSETIFNLDKFRIANLHFHDLDKWNEMEWACALSGEVGELCNLLKKKYGRNEEVSDEKIGEELADILTYLDLLAARLNLKLSEVTLNKFDKVSKKRNWNYPIRSFLK